MFEIQSWGRKILDKDVKIADTIPTAQWTYKIYKIIEHYKGSNCGVHFQEHV